MKNRYIINVVVPLLNKNYEIMIPNNILVGNLMYIFVESIEELKKNKNNLFLEFYDSFNGNIINLEQNIFTSEIQNGSKIILI